MGVPPLRVLIADDEVLLSAGLARLLEDAGMEVVAQIPTADRIVPAVERLAPDVAIVDVQMPPGRADDGLRAAIAIRRAADIATNVLVLSNFLEERYPLELIGDDARGAGYLLKERVADVDSFVDAVRRVAAGGSALDPEVVRLMVGRHRRADPLAALTPREREVLELMAEGLSNQGVAGALGVSQAVVEKHATHLFQKLGADPAPDRNRRVTAVLTLLRAS